MMNAKSTDFGMVTQTPETAFEESLMRSFIKMSLPKDCPIMFSELRGDFLLGDEWSDGWLTLKIMIANPGEGDPFSAMFETAYFSGRIRVLEDPHPASEVFRTQSEVVRTQVEWEFEAQTDKGYTIVGSQGNYLPYLPTLAKA